MQTQDGAQTATIEERWRQAGYPAELLQQARAAGLGEGYIEGLTRWPNLERAQLHIGWAQTLAEGRMRFRQVTVADNEAFSALWANSPEEIGDWDVTAERGPNAFAQFALQERPVLNALFDGTEMVACVGFSIRQTIVAGQRLGVRYGQAMRVHNGHRRKGYADWVRSLPWAIGLDRANAVQYDFIRARNMTMERWNAQKMPSVDSVPKREGEVPGVPVTVQQFPARDVDTAPGVRSVQPDELDRCVELINRTHAGRDLFRPYTREFLEERIETAFYGEVMRQPVYGYDSYFVLERGGEIVACAGLWDRGRDVRERWRHRESGNERLVSVAALLDFGCAAGAEQALATLIEHGIARAHALGRDYLVAPLATLPAVASLLERHAPEPETRYLQWRADTPALQPPPFVDLVYW